MSSNKGDVSRCAESDVINNKIVKRYEQLDGEKWSTCRYSGELSIISRKKVVRLRSAIFEVSFMLLSKILSLNKVQTNFVSSIYRS
ncbi:unnamed protein product [Rotaria sp. Silwood1]|nr:unnamed protein product [Rotaria sp. Silwood1]